MWTDTHCHLDEDRYRGEGNKNLGGTIGVLENARAAQVSRFITVGCDADSSRAAIECAHQFDDVWASVGLHPHEAVHGVDTIVELISSPRVIAIAAQIQLAHQFQLPLIIHTRDAWDDTFDVLRAEGVPAQTIFHCFTGGPDEARRCLDVGAFLSFSGIVTFKSAQDVAEAATLCPLDRILVETDSPYLAPIPLRGRTNQPANVAIVGTHIADLKHLHPAEMARVTTHNACIAFPLLTS